MRRTLDAKTSNPMQFLAVWALAHHTWPSTHCEDTPAIHCLRNYFAAVEFVVSGPISDSFYKQVHFSSAREKETYYRWIVKHWCTKPHLNHLQYICMKSFYGLLHVIYHCTLGGPMRAHIVVHQRIPKEAWPDPITTSIFMNLFKAQMLLWPAKLDSAPSSFPKDELRAHTHYFKVKSFHLWAPDHQYIATHLREPSK